MPAIEEILTNRKQTVNRIFDMACNFYGDLSNFFVSMNGQEIPLPDLTLSEYFDFVKSIPYVRDAEPVEVVARPSIIVRNFLKGIGKDCKKAAVLMGAWFNYHTEPWRLVVMSTRPDGEFHHVFTQVGGGSSWLNVDATYSNYRLGQVKNATAWEYYKCPLFS